MLIIFYLGCFPTHATFLPDISVRDIFSTSLVMGGMTFRKKYSLNSEERRHSFEIFYSSNNLHPLAKNQRPQSVFFPAELDRQRNVIQQNDRAKERDAVNNVIVSKWRTVVKRKAVT